MLSMPQPANQCGPSTPAQSIEQAEMCPHAAPSREWIVFGDTSRHGGDFRKNTGKTAACKVGLGSGAGRVL